ncbi:hypothetical protein INR49_014799 [Caranx melampygus]|nr:hypothetical protein INR49_014799 [Caranx melampygus]
MDTRPSLKTSDVHIKILNVFTRLWMSTERDAEQVLTDVVQHESSDSSSPFYAIVLNLKRNIRLQVTPAGCSKSQHHHKRLYYRPEAGVDGLRVRPGERAVLGVIQFTIYKLHTDTRDIGFIQVRAPSTQPSAGIKTLATAGQRNVLSIPPDLQSLRHLIHSLGLKIKAEVDLAAALADMTRELAAEDNDYDDDDDDDDDDVDDDDGFDAVIIAGISCWPPSAPIDPPPHSCPLKGVCERDSLSSLTALTMWPCGDLVQSAERVPIL